MNAAGTVPEQDWKIIKATDNAHNPITNFQLLNLEPVTYYEVELRAENEKGWSVMSSPFVFRTSDGLLTFTSLQ